MRPESIPQHRSSQLPIDPIRSATQVDAAFVSFSSLLSNTATSGRTSVSFAQVGEFQYRVEEESPFRQYSPPSERKGESSVHSQVTDSQNSNPQGEASGESNPDPAVSRKDPQLTFTQMYLNLTPMQLTPEMPKSVSMIRTVIVEAIEKIKLLQTHPGYHFKFKGSAPLEIKIAMTDNTAIVEILADSDVSKEIKQNLPNLIAQLKEKLSLEEISINVEELSQDAGHSQKDQKENQEDPQRQHHYEESLIEDMHE